MDVSVLSSIFSKRPAVYAALFFSLLTACGQQGGPAGSGEMTTVGVKMTIPSVPSTALASFQPRAPVPVPVSSVKLSVTAPGGVVVASTTVSVEPGQEVTIS